MTAGYSKTCEYSALSPSPTLLAAMTHAHTAYPTAAPTDARSAYSGARRAVRRPAATRPITGSSVNPRGLRPKGPSGACSSTWCAASQSSPLTCSGIIGSEPAGAAVAHSSSVSDTATNQPPTATTTAARTP